ncbi:hypothetical protein MMPV_008250 [Pyropia vietnamensis]
MMDRLPLLRIASTSCLVWAGVSLGTSLAAASKRTSPLLSAPVAVDVQRRISSTSLAVEAALGATAAAALAAVSRSGKPGAVVTTLGAAGGGRVRPALAAAAGLLVLQAALVGPRINAASHDTPPIQAAGGGGVSTHTAAPAPASTIDGEDNNGVVHALRQATVDSVFYSRKGGNGGKVTVTAAAPKVAVSVSTSSSAAPKGPNHSFAHKLYVAAEAGKMLSAGMAGFFLIP